MRTIEIDLCGKWRLYTNTIPDGSRAIGTVTRASGDTGALVYIEKTGRYVQVNAGVLRTLDQRPVLAALEEKRTGQGGPGRGQGRRAADGASCVERKNVTLDANSIEVLRSLGEGDLSLGIRRAAARLKSS